LHLKTRILKQALNSQLYHARVYVHRDVRDASLQLTVWQSHTSGQQPSLLMARSNILLLLLANRYKGVFLKHFSSVFLAVGSVNSATTARNFCFATLLRSRLSAPYDDPAHVQQVLFAVENDPCCYQTKLSRVELSRVELHVRWKSAIRVSFRD